MPRDKFGTSASAAASTSYVTQHLSSLLYQPVNGLRYTEDGHVDMENVKITNVKTPTSGHDAVNKAYLDAELRQIVASLRADHVIINQKNDMLKKHVDDVDLKFTQQTGNISRFIPKVTDNAIKASFKHIQEIYKDHKNEFEGKLKAIEQQNSLTKDELEGKIKVLEHLLEPLQEPLHLYLSNLTQRVEKVEEEIAQSRKKKTIVVTLSPPVTSKATPALKSQNQVLPTTTTTTTTTPKISPQAAPKHNPYHQSG